MTSKDSPIKYRPGGHYKKSPTEWVCPNCKGYCYTRGSLKPLVCIACSDALGREVYGWRVIEPTRKG